MKKSRIGVHTLLLLSLSSMWGCVPLEHASGIDEPHATVQVSQHQDEAITNTAAPDDDETEFALMVDEEDDLTSKEKLTPPEPAETLAEEVQGFGQLGQTEENIQELLTPSGFPLTMNRHVAFFLDFFQNKHPKSFVRWLARGAPYIPKMKEEFRKAKLPEELAYLPMIESGFSLTALSGARAAGPWQFMPGTAQQYGLTVNNYLDERLNPWRSTKAAVEHLGDLYEEFGSWHLAVAAYNAGSGKLQNAIKSAGTNNFWEIARSSSIEDETKMFVPKLIAAILISENPAKYGFTSIEPEQAPATDTFTVPGWTSLKAVAVASDTNVDVLHKLNTELVAGVTPPGHPYSIRLPSGKRELVAKNLPKVKAIVSTQYKDHSVEKDETLAQICKKYNLTATVLLKANNLRSAKLRPGTRLRVPFQSTAYTLATDTKDVIVASAASERTESVKTASSKTDQSNDKTVALISSKRKKQEEKAPPVDQDRQQSAKKAKSEQYYEVRGGDTLYAIAKKFNTTPDQLKYLNNLANDSLSPGLRLKVQRGV